MQNFVTACRLRATRRRRMLRAARRARDLTRVRDRTGQIKPRDILLFACVRNEAPRLDWMLRHYRAIGVDHFLIVDNGSRDGSVTRLAQEPDVSLWRTEASYARASCGVDWLNALRRRYGCGHWCLTVDADETLVYPHVGHRPLRALTDWLDRHDVAMLPCLLLDLFPRGSVEAAVCPSGRDPTRVAAWFDPANYRARRDTRLGAEWIQGGVRARAFFADRPEVAPALNKVPLLRWQSDFVYHSSTHVLLPRALNVAAALVARQGVPTGVLLHTKFVAGFRARAREEVARAEHFANAAEYRAYLAGSNDCDRLWHSDAARYDGWRQLVGLGLMAQGAWT